MAKKDYYNILKNVDKIINGNNTNFLDPGIFKKVSTKLKGYDYKKYYPYKDSDKVILYKNVPPKIKLLEIISYEKLTHREIMGSLYNLNISSEMFGDIIIYNNHYYIIVMNSIYGLIIEEFNMIGNKHIKLKEVPLTTLNNYERKYEDVELIVSSLRIDTTVSRLIGSSRYEVKKKIVNDEIIINYEPCQKPNYILNKDDIFSIRKHGKYKFGGIIKNTKKNNYIIKLYKYIDN